MRRTTSLILLFAAVFLGSNCQNSQETEASTTAKTSVSEATTPMHNTLTDEDKAAGWELLFDGKAIDQWKGYNRADLPSAWIVKDGTMTLQLDSDSKDGGDIVTKSQYDNFEFQLDFKLWKATNSGILYKVVEMKDTPIWHNAPEYQLIDDYDYKEKAKEDQFKTHLTADNYDIQGAAGKTFKPIGEWNTAKIVVNNGKVEHHLNGKKVVEYDTNSEAWATMVQNSKFKDYKNYGKATAGHIGLQDHGHDIAFRNLKIRKL